MDIGLDDLSVRFIINLPKEELETPERIGFQIEEAQWFYEDFIRPLDPTLPSLNLRTFCRLVFQYCPLLKAYSGVSEAVYEEFLQYKTRVPVRGAILLDQQMNNVVLVKGWKKGAKWSFPRGKINKDEKDVDCAVREVYEETGFDVREAGLIPENEEDVKYIEISLREQQMRLYVFRGVPMETHFEPKTRKEISKVQWYKLSDLPTVKKDKQLREQAASGQDGVKGADFYMVAPFLGPLRKWIGQQRRADKTKLRAAHPRGLIIEDDDTEAEANGRAEENAISEIPSEHVVDNEAGHMERLLAGLHSSKQGLTSSLDLPEVSDSNKQTPDPALELKRLLSVGNASQPLIHQPAPQKEESNPLLALLRGPSATHAAQEKISIPPATPIENITNSPPKARTPHHRHPRPPSLTNMPPPPQFSKSPKLPLHAHILLKRPYVYHNLYSPLSDIPPNFVSHPDLHVPPHLPHDLSPGFVQPGPSMLPSPGIWPHPLPHHPPGARPPMHAATMPPPPPQPFKPYQRPIDPLSYAPLPQFPGLHSPAIPQASSLPPPKLTSHSLALLNALKSPHEQPPKKAPYEQRTLVPSTILPSRKKQANPAESLTSPSSLPSADSAAQELPTSPPAVTEPQPSIQPNTGKPRSAHQDALLNLFKSASTQQPPSKPSSSLTPPGPTEPIELSAQHSPHASRSSFMPPPKLPMLSTNVPRHPSPGLTSATVSGPLNAPDFETMKRAHAQKFSPSSATTAVPPTGGLVPVEMSSVVSPTDIKSPQPKPFQPTILKRPPQPASAGPSSQRSTPAPLGQTWAQQQRDDDDEGQRKSTLLSLFTAPTTRAEKAITPVSPLPDFVTGVQSQGGSKRPSVTGIGVGSGDEDLAGRSRISSIASAAGSGSGDMDGKSRHVSLTGIPNFGVGLSGSKDETPVTSPVAKAPGSQSNTDFLLGFLQGVAKSAEGMKR